MQGLSEVRTSRLSAGYAARWFTSEARIGPLAGTLRPTLGLRLIGVAPIAIGVAPLREKPDLVPRLRPASACDMAYRKYHATPQLR